MVLKEEFDFSRFGFIDPPHQLYGPVLDCVPWKLQLLVQGYAALHTCVFMLVSMTTDIFNTESASWFTYLPTWNYVIVTYYFLVTFFSNYNRYRQKQLETYHSYEPLFEESVPKYFDRSEKVKLYTIASEAIASGADESLESTRSTMSNDEIQTRLTCFERIHWILFDISFCLSLLVTVGYWSCIFEPSNLVGGLHCFLTIDRHVIVYVLQVVEYSLKKVPVHLLHFVYPMMVFVTYAVFNYVYWKVSGNIVYKIADWNNHYTMVFALAVVSIFAVMCLQVILYCVDCLKWSIMRELNRKRASP